MSYGLQVTGTGGIYQLDSETSSTISLVVASSGITTSSGGHYISGAQTGDLIFARPNTTSNAHLFFNAALGLFDGPVKYKLVRATDSANITLSGDYGITVLNAAGTKIFDSRGMNTSVVFGPIYQPGEFDGGKRFPTGTQTSYSTANNTVLNLSSNSDHTVYDNSYVLVNSGFALSQGTGQVRINGYYFDRTNKYIYFQSYFEENSPGTVFQTYPNSSAVVVGTLTGA